MLSKYYKIELPLHNKDYFTYKTGELGKYKYKGTAFLIFEKETNKLLFNTLLLDENQDIFGADAGRYGKDYRIKKFPSLFKYREENFNHSIKKGWKNSSIFKGKIKDLNNLIINHKLTIKDVDSFISGSHSSGGLNDPGNDPVRLYYEEHDPIKEIFGTNLFNEKNEWNIFSILSNLKEKSKNTSFTDKINLDYLNKIKTKDIKTFLTKTNIKFVPYKKTYHKEFHIPLLEAFASQNYEKFIDPIKANAGVNARPNESYKTIDKDQVGYILKVAETRNKKYLSNQLRGIWIRNIEKDIELKNYKKDFITGTTKVERAHIIENKYGASYLISNDIDIEDKRKLADKILNKNNYLLLTRSAHNSWDAGEIVIEDKGTILNTSLEERDYEVILGNEKDILSIYSDILNEDRQCLLKERIKINALELF